MTDPINLTSLRARITEIIGPTDLVSWDREPDYIQVYGDNGTICTTDAPDAAALLVDVLRSMLALIDTAESARKMVNEYIAGYYDQSDTFGELEQVLAKFTTNTNT